MELKSAQLTQAPGSPDRLRLVGEVTYDDRPGSSETYWFEVPARYADSLTTTGNPWLVCLLPLAMRLGEPLRLALPVDPVLLENVRELMQLWQFWHPRTRIVRIETDVLVSAPPTAGKTAAFFSGGVDSFFTVLQRDQAHRAGEGSPINELLSVGGFDIPLRNRAEIELMLASMREVAGSLEMNLIDITTNLRETRLEKHLDWAEILHGPALASVALALESRYGHVLIASTLGYENLRPWGSHPLADPLFSTSQLRIAHHGAAFDRFEKCEFITRFDVAMRALRVCWKTESSSNCCACNKCFRMMATLEVLGVRDRCRTFRPNAFDLARLARVYSSDDTSTFWMREVQQAALQRGRRDVARAIEASFRYTRLLNRLVPWLKTIERARFVWRFKQPLERALISPAIT
jgi:hypothetical protein